MARFCGRLRGWVRKTGYESEEKDMGDGLKWLVPDLGGVAFNPGEEVHAWRHGDRAGPQALRQLLDIRHPVLPPWSGAGPDHCSSPDRTNLP